MTDTAPAPWESLAPVRPGVRGRMLNTLLRVYFKRPAARMGVDAASINAARARLDRVAHFGEREDDTVRIEAAQIAERPVEIIEPVGIKPDAPTLLYIHGGGFVAGSPATHRGITRYLAKALAARVIAPDYRLAPEHPYPAAFDDCLAVYDALLAKVPARSVVVGGDSAGGNLALTLVLALRDRGGPLPIATFALSPWADLTGSGDSVVTMARRDAMLPAEKMADVAAMYAPDRDLTAPSLSPAFADYAGLTPLLVHACTTEILLDDARRVVGRAAEAGVDAKLRLWYKLPHVFHAFADFLPPARLALAEIAAFAQRHLVGRV